jgi:hypothetical protein
MKQIVGVIDSFNFNSENLEKLFYSKKTYHIEIVKSISIFEPKKWLTRFGKPLTQNIVEAKILHTNMGLTLPIKRYSASQHKQTLEFAGLHAYNESAEQRKTLLKELITHIQDEFISRIDIAIDFKSKVPNRVLQALNKSRTPYQYKNTSYLKTGKEKKSNPKINILIYPKHIKENLDSEIWRLEFSFRGGYFNKHTIKELDKAYKKMEKTIKRLSSVNVKIKAL